MTHTPDPKRLAARIESLKQDPDDGLPGLTEVLRGEAELPPPEEVDVDE